ncbi:MAG: hypothetical protein SGARI_005384 [Bacillariaceae sp.]
MMSITDECPNDGQPRLCNSGGLICQQVTMGCADFASQNGFVDTDGCIEFCEMNMQAENYFVQFVPNKNDASLNQCGCIEQCLDGFVDINENQNAFFAAIFAVGDDKDCPTIDTLPDPCVGTTFETCGPGACSGEAGQDFDNVENLQECVDLCYTRGFPVVDFTGRTIVNCKCYAQFGDGDADCTFGPGLRSIGSVEEVCPSG